MMNEKERKEQRAFERNFARERRVDLLALLVELAKEIKSCGEEVPKTQQSFYDSILEQVIFFKAHVK